jgi:hypothetical protein
MSTKGCIGRAGPYNPGMASRKRPATPAPPSRRRQATPAELGLHPVSLILSEDLYEGLRLYCFSNRMKHQELLRKLLGEFLAAKGIAKVVAREGGVDYELLKAPPPPVP